MLFLCLAGGHAAVLAGPADPGPPVHESAVPDEPAGALWAVTARTLTGM